MKDSSLIYDLNEIGKISKIIIKSIKKKNKVLFSGPLGSGKTTLIKSIMHDLGYNDHVSSPTFSLINEYIIKDKMIYHIDLYRVNGLDELYEIGFEEYLRNGNLCLIEWPEIAIKIIDKDFIHIKLKEISKTKRSIEIKSL
jgi:tRNA threonylcarbamoyladenosine biosynthesis protein TsaE